MSNGNVSPSTDEPPQAVSGQLTAWTLNEGRKVFVRVSQVAAVIALEEDGPTRFQFAAGGHLDVCGGAELWRRLIRISELEALST